MGWTFSPSWPNKRALVEHLIAEEGCTHTDRHEDGTVTEFRGTFRTIAHAVHGNHLWSVVDVGYPSAPQFNTRFIALFLMASGREDGWGYKDLEESMGPNAVDCPLRFLDLVPAPDPTQHPYATGWRDNVRAFHDGKLKRQRVSKDIQPGQRWLLTPGCPFEWLTITGKASKRGQWYAKTPDGATVRVRTQLLVRPMGNKEVTVAEFAAATGLPQGLTA